MHLVLKRFAPLLFAITFWYRFLYAHKSSVSWAALKLGWYCFIWMPQFEPWQVIIINVYYRLREKRNALSKDLQERFTKEWQSTQKQSHVVVHIPSVSGRELADLRSEHQEILQMARLCDTADTDVDVIYIAAIEVDREVEGYWRKLLEVGGVEDPERRYRYRTNSAESKNDYQKLYPGRKVWWTEAIGSSGSRPAPSKIICHSVCFRICLVLWSCQWGRSNKYLYHIYSCVYRCAIV